MKALSEATKIHRTVLHKILNGLPRVAGKLFLPDVAKVLYEKFQPKTKRLG